jgi:SAM-dependent methyltransferase
VKRLALLVLRAFFRRFGWDLIHVATHDSTALKRIARLLGDRVRLQLQDAGLELDEQWLSRLDDEIGFWIHYFGTDGAQFSNQDVVRKLSRQRDFAFERLFATRLPGNRLRVLDVGAGPVSVVGTRSSRYAITLVAVDPLAAAYSFITELFAVKPPVTTDFAIAEKLDAKFAPRSFDLVHARNCIDHALDPIRAMGQMASLVAAAGWMVLDHADHEGRHERYDGLHRWDLFVLDGRYWAQTSLGAREAFDHQSLGLSMQVEHYMASGKAYSRVLYRRDPEAPS